MAAKIWLPLVFNLSHILIIVLIINSEAEAVNRADVAAAGGGTGAPATGSGTGAPAAGDGAPAAGGGAPASGGGTVFDITKYGAKPNADATQGILAAWKEACASTSPSEVQVPAGEYLLGPIRIQGPCKSKVTINILGNFKAVDIAQFKGEGFWVKFAYVDGLTVQAGQGAGIFDGQGAVDWHKNDCAKNKKCNMLPFSLRYDFLNNSLITGITSKNAKAFHMNVLGCNQLSIHQITIDAPADSPNTDGIHLALSNSVNITDSKIGTGDDCISIGDGMNNLYIEKVSCGPGHGISIGSLGSSAQEKPVQNVTVKSCSFNGTDNGVRIKTWFDSFENLVTGVRFEDITVDKVWNPVIIDQEYCPYNHCKSKAPSKVKLNDIKIMNVRGTSTRVETVMLVCSAAAPCEKVEVSDIDLQYVGTVPGQAQFVCKNIKPVTSGKIVPPACNAQPTTKPEL